jgi:hypothetical protein
MHDPLYGISSNSKCIMTHTVRREETTKMFINQLHAVGLAYNLLPLPTNRFYFNEGRCDVMIFEIFSLKG